MKKYFKLFEECFIVNGKTNYAVYNVITGKVFTLPVNEGMFCALTENNQEIEEARIKAVLSAEEAEKVVDKLIQAGLGDVYDYPVSADKVNIMPKWTEKTFFKQAPRLNRATIELDYPCGGNCNFCSSGRLINRFRCLTCNGTGTESASDQTVFRIIDLISERGCEELYLKNGDLIGNWEHTYKVIGYAHDRGIQTVKISVVRPLDDPEIIRELIRRDIAVVYQLYLSEPVDLDAVLRQIDLLSEIKVTYLLLVSFEQKESAFKVINTMMSKYPNIPLLLDFIVSSNQADVPDEYFRIESTFRNISFASYSLRQMHNECFYMNFCFDRNGDIYPCAGLKHEKTGSIDSIDDALRADKLKRFYHMSLGQKAVCSECELRYACNSCESLNYTFLNSYDRNVLCFHDK